MQTEIAAVCESCSTQIPSIALKYLMKKEREQQMGHGKWLVHRESQIRGGRIFILFYFNAILSLNNLG